MPSHTIFFLISLFLIIGIVLGSMGLSIWFAIIFVIIINIILLNKNPPLFIALSFFVVVGLSYAHVHAVINSDKIIFGEERVYKGLVIGYPESRLKSQKLIIQLREPYSGKVFVYTNVYPSFEYGDILELKGVVNKSPSGRINMMSFPEVSVISKDNGSKFRGILFSIRRSLIDNLKVIMPPDKSALISGLLFGDTSEFSAEFKESMRASGTTHIVALSGYNVSIIAMMVSNGLTYFINRKKVFYISALIIIAFVLMTGAEASIVRAAIMGIILLLARKQGRTYSLRNGITFTALIMLLFNPSLMVYDVGFQLSFAALLGIVYLEPRFKKHLPIKEEPGFIGWRDNMRQTLSAQLAVAPISIITFGYISPISILANVLILGFVPVTMLLGFVASILGLISFNLSLIVGIFTSVLLEYEEFIINLFAFNWI